jgi:hypothetical protein
MTRRISTPRRLICIGTARVIIMWAALSAGCLPLDGMGN